MCLVTCILSSIPIAVVTDGNRLSLDDRTLEMCTLRLSKEPDGLLVFHFIDAETQTEIDSLDVLMKMREDKYTRPLREWQARWNRPGYYSYKIVLDPYVSVILDSIHLPADSAVIVTLQMKKGDGVMRIGVTADSLVRVMTVSLDGIFPRNEIIGKVLDGSSETPVSGASIYCEETGFTASTDSAGQFTLWLSTLKSVTLNAWHPLYDSIRFEVSKEYIRTTKEVEIHYEAPRRTVDGETINFRGDSTALFLVDMMGWSSWGIRPHEFMNKIYTYEVLPGEVFGRTSRWTYYECLPFRFIRELPDKSAWVQFSREFGLMTENGSSKTNYSFLSDSAVKLNTHTLDAGTAVSLSLQPDYSPRGLIKQKGPRDRRGQPAPKEKSGVDSCDIIKAQVERIQIKNLLAILDGDFAHLARACSESYKPRDNMTNLPLEEFFRLSLEGKFPGKYSDKRLLELFRLRSAEMYVHNLCAEPANERFLEDSKRRQFVPQDGDVYVYWPGAAWSGGMSLVYRNENGEWKIVEAF